MRLSISPLVEALRLGEGESVSRALGISGTALTNYTVNGLDEKTADRLAARAGFVAWSLWPELMDEAIADITVACAAPDCPVTFVHPPLRWGQKRRRYCSRTCQIRTNRRRQYATNPVERERRREASRRYKAEVREAQRRRAERKAAA